MVKSKKFIWIAIVAIVVVAIGFVIFKAMEKKPTEVSEVFVKYGELIENVSTNGIVESSISKNVYTNLNYTVKSVNVSVGQSVSEGDVLAVLDTDSLLLDLEQEKSRLKDYEKNNSNQIKTVKTKLESAVSNQKNNTNNSIITAKTAVENAKTDLDNKERTYLQTKKDNEQNTNNNLIQAKNSLDIATMDLDNKEDELEKSQSLYNSGIISQNDYGKAQTAYDNAKIAYENAKSSYQSVETQSANSLETSQKAYEAALVVYNNALSSLQAVETSTAQDIENLQVSLEGATNTANIETQLVTIKKLESNLEKAIIKSPISGVVTAVYAKEGTNSNGVMFVVENLNTLKVATSIKEFDAATVVPDMDVIIKSDATGDKEFKGKVEKVYPAANKDNGGNVIDDGDVLFTTDVNILDKDPSLKVGMNVRLDIITKKIDNTYYVSFDSVRENENGANVIYTLKEIGKNKYEVVEHEVKTGLETDLYIEIIADFINEDTKVVSSVDNINVGDIVSLKK